MVKQTALPPIPDGFVLDQVLPAVPEIPPIPDGFVLDPVPGPGPAPSSVIADEVTPAANQTIPAANQINPLAGQEGLAGVTNTVSGFADTLVRNMLPGLVRSVGNVAEAGGDFLEEKIPLSGLTKEELAQDQVRGITNNIARWLENRDLGFNPEETASIQDVFADPTVAPRFIAEQGVISLPYMLGAMLNPAATVSAMTGDLAQERAGNDNRPDANLTDMGIVAPSAVISTFLERFGARGMVPDAGSLLRTPGQLVGAVGKAAGKEALSEGIEEGAQNAATTVGTEKGFNPTEFGLGVAGGALAGGGMGGAVRTVTGAAELATRQPALPAPPLALPPPASPPIMPEPDLPPIPEGFVFEPPTPQPVPAPEPTTETTPQPGAGPTAPQPGPDVPAAGPTDVLPPAAPTPPTDQGPVVSPPEAGPVPGTEPAPPVEPATAPAPTPPVAEPVTPEPAPAPPAAPPTEPAQEPPVAPTTPEPGPDVYDDGVPTDLPPDANAPQFRAWAADKPEILAEFEEKVANEERGLLGLDENDQTGPGKWRTRQRTVTGARRNEAENIVLREMREKYATGPETITAPPRTVPDEPNIQKAAENFKTVDDAAAWIERHSKDDTFRVIAKRLRRGLIEDPGNVYATGFSNTATANDFRVYVKGKKGQFEGKPSMKKWAPPQLGKSAAGLWFSNEGIVIPDAKNNPLVDAEETVLHELIHSATGYAIARVKSGTPLTTETDKQLYRDIRALQKAIKNHPTVAKIKADPMHPLFQWVKSGQAKAFMDDVDELLTYGLTSPSAIALMKELDASTEAKPKATFWSAFMEAIQKFLNLSDAQLPTLIRVAEIAERAFNANDRTKQPKGTTGKLEDATDMDPVDAPETNIVKVTPSSDPNADPEVEPDMMADAAPAAPTEEDTTRVPRGTLTPRTEQVSFTNRASIYEEAFRVAGLTPDQGRLLPPDQQKNTLAKVLRETFKLGVRFPTGKAQLSTIDAVDQMLDAFRNVRFMMHVLSLPTEAVSLGGRLTLALERFRGQYLGAYEPSSRTIYMPGRSNSFAHEWMHALDDRLGEVLTPQAKGRLLSRIARNEGLDPNDDIQAAYVNLVNTMFFDETELALTMLDLETKAQAVLKNGPNAGQPTAAALEAREKLERLRSGATRMKIAPSAYKKNSEGYSPAGAGYYGSVHEMMARAFEAYVASKIAAAGGTSEFITKGDQNYLGAADRRLEMTYPKSTDRARIFAAFDTVFDHLRNQQVLGSDPVAQRPADVDIVDPQHWNKIALSLGETGVIDKLKQDAVMARNAFRNATGASPEALMAGLKKSMADFKTNLGIPGDNPLNANLMAAGRAVLDFRRRILGSMRSFGKALVKRNKGKGGEFLDFVWDRAATDIGTGEYKAQTFEEEREAITLQTANAIDSLLRGNGFTSLWKGISLTEAQNDTVRDLMFGKKIPDADPKLEAVAAGLRRKMTDLYQKARAAGLDIGFIEDKGYLPRVIQHGAVENNPVEFLERAGEVYGVVYDGVTDGIDPQDMLRLAGQISQAPGVSPEVNPRQGPYAAELKAVRDATKAVKKAQQAVEKNPLDTTAVAALKTANAALTDAMDKLKAIVRPDFMRVHAEAWKGRILIGDSLTFDTRGPASDFMKERKLPSQADDILKDFYETDVL
jgi:hypothetical protein